MDAQELLAYLDHYLEIGRYADRSNNGLQVQCPDRVTRIALAVDACLASFEQAVAWGAQLLIVHHGLFWSEHIQVIGAHYRRLRTLIMGNCGLYAAHIPLDAHPEVGNNIQLARVLGLEDIERWGRHKGDLIGWTGTLPQPQTPEQLRRMLEAHIGPARFMQLCAERPLCRRVAICSGFGISLLDQALEAGADTFVTGEPSHVWAQPVAERPINVIYGGHYNTETVGLKALAAHLAARFDLQAHFIDLPTQL